MAFGPKNLGLSQEESRKRAIDALQLVGIKEEQYTLSPFELSGGQKRRVAIAGVLAMQPEVLILDEPAAGLDPGSRKEILDTIVHLYRETGMTVILSSHSMEDMAEYAERLLVMNQGELVMDGLPHEIFGRYKELEKMGLSAPKMTYLMHSLAEKGYDLSTDILTVSDAGRGNSEFMEEDENGGRREMIRDITIGQYYPQSSVIHRLDPRVKLLGTVLFVISVFLIHNVPAFIIVTAAMLALLRCPKYR